MILARIMVWLSALTFVALGLAALLFPAAVLAPVDLALTTATARADVRAVYGGLDLGVGLCLVWCALAPARLPLGSLLACLVLGGIASGRLVGILVDLDAGAGTPSMWAFFASEALGAVLAGAAYRAVTRVRP